MTTCKSLRIPLRVHAATFHARPSGIPMHRLTFLYPAHTTRLLTYMYNIQYLPLRVLYGSTPGVSSTTSSVWSTGNVVEAIVAIDTIANSLGLFEAYWSLLVVQYINYWLRITCNTKGPVLSEDATRPRRSIFYD